MPHDRTVVVSTPLGLQGHLHLTSKHAALDSLWATLDAYQQKYGTLPKDVDLAESLPPRCKKALGDWLWSKHIMVAWHDGETACVLMTIPETREGVTHG